MHLPLITSFRPILIQYQNFNSIILGIPPSNYHRDSQNQHYGGGNNYRPHPRASPPTNLSQSPPARTFAKPAGNTEPALPALDESNGSSEEKTPVPEPAVEELLDINNYNPLELDLDRIDLARLDIIFFTVAIFCLLNLIRQSIQISNFVSLSLSPTLSCSLSLSLSMTSQILCNKILF